MGTGGLEGCGYGSSALKDSLVLGMEFPAGERSSGAVVALGSRSAISVVSAGPVGASLVVGGDSALSPVGKVEFASLRPFSNG